MMWRVAAVFLALLGPVASAETARTTIRIAYLSELSAEANRAWLGGLREGMRALGYVESKDWTLEARYADGQRDRLHNLAADLVRARPTVFLTYGQTATSVASATSGGVPVVFANVQDPVAGGLVKSLARPGGNVTGLSDAHAESVTKRLELLRDLVPDLRRVAVLWIGTSATAARQIQTLEASAAALKISLVSMPVASTDEIDAALARMKGERPVALLMLGDALITSHQHRIAERALAMRLPAMYTTRAFVQGGGLAAYGADFTDLFRRSASYVDRIARGAKPGDLPVEQASKFELTINQRTAQAIGVTVPRPLLARADHVID